MSSIKSNLLRLYIIKASKWFMLVMPIVVLFYNEHGLGMQEVFLLQAIYSVAIVVLEIPSGYFADVLGRRNTLIIGCTMGFLGFITYSLSFGFLGFLAAEMVLGFGQSLISGADSAILYDTLKVQKREEQYLKYEGRMVSLGNFAEAIAGVAGGLLAAIHIRYPYYAQALVAFVAVPAAIGLVEPKVAVDRMTLSMSSVLKAVRYAIVDNAKLRWNIIYSSVVGASTLTMAWFVQPWFMRAELPVTLFGVLWTLLNLSVGVTAIYAYRIERAFGDRNTVVALTLTLAIGFFGAAYVMAPWGLVFLFAFYLARGVATPVLKDYINRITSSEVRATVLSVRSFIIRILFAICAPFYGWYTDSISLQGAIAIAGLIFVVLTGITFYFFVRSGNLRNG